MANASPPTVAIVGASADRSKYGAKSVRAHLRQGYKVFPINPKGGEVEGLPVYTSLSDIPKDELTDGRLDRVSFYVPPEIGLGLLPQVAAANPREFFLNPGSESVEVVEVAAALGLDPIQACSIIAIGETPD